MSEAKFDMGKIVAKIHKNFDSDDLKKKIGTGADLRTLTEKDFIKLPEFWTESTRTYGLPFGKIVLIAGSADSGKSSLAIQATKAALDQGCGVIYCETENKTTEKDFIAWGVDPTQILLVQATIAEELATLLFEAWDGFKEAYPDTPLLVIVDSLGNAVSTRDSEIDLMESSSQPGGKGKINRLIVNKIVAKMHQDNTAVLLISYTYENMGSVGKTNAGGRALDLFSCLTYQTTRKAWIEKTVKGRKVRVGAEVLYTLYKNHLNKVDPGEKQIVFRITADGMEYVNKDKEKEAEDDE